MNEKDAASKDVNGGNMGGEKKFYPEYLFEVLLVVLAVMDLTLVLSLMFPKEMGRQIVFSAPFQPSPEWYFLWLFELLRYFPGRWAFLGAVVLPVANVAVLVAIPFIDRGKAGRLKASIAMAVIFISFLIFTLKPMIGGN